MTKHVAGRGTMECPYCGKETPHWHEPKEIKGIVPGLVPRLSQFADDLGTTLGFYGAMHRAYGTDYSYRAEAALIRDLRQVIAKLTTRKQRQRNDPRY